METKILYCEVCDQEKARITVDTPKSDFEWEILKQAYLCSNHTHEIAPSPGLDDEGKPIPTPYDQMPGKLEFFDKSVQVKLSLENREVSHRLASMALAHTTSQSLLKEEREVGPVKELAWYQKLWAWFLSFFKK